ncbi:MAG: hypothetical protein H6595_07910 [Flavobacteriales bacterium]|nr:hypothetical protein [Flavobacteriales bacterium]MCB9167391.1 hypothetical protein [Flavobacteriales bacterium]
MLRELNTFFGIILIGASSAQPPLQPYPGRAMKQPVTAVGQGGHDASRPTGSITRSAGATLWSEDFENGMNGWSVNTLTGPVDWAITSTGNTGGFTPGPLQSTSGFPGGHWIVADSDLNGVPGVLENTTITSPAITGLDTVSTMLLRFEQSFRQLNDDQTLVEVSANGGANWTTYPVNTDIPGNVSTPGAPLAQEIVINISDALNGGSNDIRIRFHWLSTEGYTYSWQVDDVSLVAADDNDLRLLSATYSDWSTAESDFASLPYSIYPLNEVRPLHFKGIVMNNGSEPQTNVHLVVDVDGPGPNDVTLTSSSIDLAPGQVDSLFIEGFTPVAVQGDWLLDIQVAQDQTDDEPSDNSIAQRFAIDEFLFARDRGAMDGDYDNGGDAYQLGNWFHVQDFDDVLTGIDVAVSDRTDAGAIINAVLYDANLDYVMETDEHTVTNSDLNHLGDAKFITLPLISPVTLDQDADYFVAINHYGGSDEVWTATSGTSIAQTSLIQDVDGTWYYIEVTPMVRMNFGPDVGIDGPQAGFASIGARPTVFTSSCTAILDLSRPARVGWKLMDPLGRTVATGAPIQKGAGHHEWDIPGGDLAAGSYVLVMDVDGSTTSTRIVRAMDR